MLGRDRSAVFVHHREDDGIHLVPALEEFLFVGIGRLRDIVVNVAVAEMSERQRPRAGNKRGHRRVRVTNESRHRRDWHRNVVFDRAAGVALHLAKHFAHAPERLGLFQTVGNGGIDDESRLVAFSQDRFEHLAQALAGLRRQFHQHVPGMRRSERIPAALAMTEHELDTLARHDLEARDVAAAFLLGDAEKFEGRFRRGDADEGGLERTRPRNEAQHRRGDYAERALGADEQVFQVVAGIVLLQFVEVIEHAAIRQHHFEAQRVRTRNAVSDGRGAAGIGGEVAANGASAFGGKELRIEPVDRGGRFARALQGDAGLAGDGVGGRIDFADAVEPIEREHDLVVMRDLAADEAGIAALRHDGRCGVVGEHEDRGHFGNRSRAEHHRRMAMEQAAHFDEIRRLRLLISDGVSLADDRRKTRKQRRIDGFARPVFRFIEHQVCPADWRLLSDK